MGSPDDRQEALHDLRWARRWRERAQFDWVEAIYRAYLLAVFGIVGIALVSGALTDAHADRHDIHEIAQRGPAVLGLLVALGIAGGLRSGSRGGPLVIEAADVQHVLMAPIDRDAFLRGLALRRLRTPVFVGAALGMLAANFAFRRLPGTDVDWLLCGTAFGALVPTAALGAALIGSGLRLERWMATLAGVAVTAWSVADLALHITTSPATMLGQLGLWPVPGAVDSAVMPLLGAVSALALAAIGVFVAGGVSAEEARRRAELADQLRFALTLQDLRAVILLRRQLAAEVPRQRPWVRLPAGRARSRAIWKRDWNSFLRWPMVRVARVAGCGAVAGLALCGVWDGTTPLVLVAAFALFLAGLDVVEPLAQEVDYPTRRDLTPMRASKLIRRHMFAPFVLMVGVCIVGVGTALVVGDPGTVLEVAAVVLGPAALLIVCAAALSSSNDPFAFATAPGFNLAQAAIPFALALVAVLPVYGAHEAIDAGYTPTQGAVFGEFNGLLFAAIALWWIGRRMNKRVRVKP